MCGACRRRGTRRTSITFLTIIPSSASGFEVRSKKPETRKENQKRNCFLVSGFLLLVLSLRAADGRRHVAERLIRARAQGGDGHQADDDNQRQHHGIFDGRRAFFLLQELDYLFRETREHDPFLSSENT